MPPCWASETNADTNGIARVRPARHRSPIVWGRYEVEMYMNKQAAAPQVRLAQTTGPRASARCFVESRAGLPVVPPVVLCIRLHRASRGRRGCVVLFFATALSRLGCPVLS